MPQTKSSRRQFLRRSALGAIPMAVAAKGLSFEAAELPEASGAQGKLSVVCVGGHPDDPESGCAGTLTRYAEHGHRVTVVYLTRGERGIRGASNDEAAKIRSAECEAACRIMGAKAVFAGQVDGSTELNRSWVVRMQDLLASEKPDVLFAQWPVDTHMDHQVASILSIRSYLGLPRRPSLYFFEVNTGSQSLGFTPNRYVDITPVLDKKKAALFAHRSQDGEGIWREHHQVIAEFRGREAGVKAAEGFVQLNRINPVSQLPGL
jgi:LmbE family N-acetylglucosaminyl deacetylase